MNNISYFLQDDAREDVYLYHQGKNYKSYDFLGAHKISDGDKEYVRFSVWAPNARDIYLVGDFNDWNEISIPLKRIKDSGVWFVCVEGVEVYDAYKYRIVTWDNKVYYKADPYAFHAETRPKTASKYYELGNYKWKDKTYLSKREKRDHRHSAMSIYELNLGSWRKHPDGEFYSYRQLAEVLPDYLSKMNFTHCEFMPITEFPFDGSWGYQVTGYFAATSRFGTPDDLMYLIDKLHQKNIGVILDWVPVHFTKDAHGLINFDGTNLYEKEDLYAANAEGWGTLYFDYYKPEVRNFLISSALFWLEKFHFDGIRVDAVAAMLYLNYGGKDLCNPDGSIENHEAIAFIQELNTVVHKYHPDTFTIAEESTAWPLVTYPVDDGGLGFDYKWNMGWMNDTLEYFEMDPIFRKDHQGKLTFSMTYCFSENYILPFSHDEVVHMKGSMINKMPGSYEDKFKQLRLLYTYMYAHPGKKLLFMGDEIASFDEWNEYKELPWSILDYENHRYMQDYVRDLNKVYKKEKPLFQVDDSYDGFEWIEHENHDESILIFERIDKKGNKIIGAFNFTPVERTNYKIGVDEKAIYKVVINSAHRRYGGVMERNNPYYSQDEKAHGKDYSINVDLPGYAAILIKLSSKLRG